MKRLLGLAAALAACWAVAAVPRAGAITGYYASTEISSTPAQPAAVNDAGMVVGIAGSGPDTSAFMWTETAGLDVIASGAATAVNDAGVVVGWTWGAGMRAFSWTAADGIVDLGPGAARAVNETGVVVGDDGPHPVVWTPTGETVDLFGDGADTGTATDVNAAGQVVGIGHPDYGSAYIFSWTADDGLTTIADYVGFGPQAVVVGDDGVVAGTYTVPPYNAAHGFVWSQADGLTDLGVLVTNGSTGVADRNSAGAVVGYTFAGPTVPPAQHAFLWTQAGGMRDLGTLGGKRSYATAIGDDGTVVGYSQVAGSAEYHAFVWTEATGMLDLWYAGVGSAALAVNGIGWIAGTVGSVNGGPPGAAMLWRPGDATPPVITVPSDIGVEATSADGAVVTFDVTAVDNADPSPVITCLHPSGSLFPIGDTEVSCSASDATGNTSVGRFRVHVRGAAEQLDALAARTHALALPSGIENSLLVKIEPRLGAFVNEVAAQSGKTIAPSDAADLVARAEQIAEVLG